MFKKIMIGVIGFVVLAGAGGGVYMNTFEDLQTDYIRKHGHSKEAQTKGRKLLLQSLESFGGWKAFQAQKEQILRVHFQDLFPSKIFQWMIMPQEFHGQKMQLTFKTGGWNNRLTFLGGKRDGGGWGVQNWKSYLFDKSGKITWKEKKEAKFWGPTYQYFILMPFYLMDAQLIAYAGEKTLQGKRYELVMATWKQFAPQKDIDQYLIWIEKKTKEIKYVQFTIRDNAPRLVGTVDYHTTFQKVGKLKLPKKLHFIFEPGKRDGIMHKLKISSYERLNKLSSRFLLPAPSKKGQK